MVNSHPDTDLDPLETQEWQDALSAVIEREGQERAHFLLETLNDQARRSGTHVSQYHPPSQSGLQSWGSGYRMANPLSDTLECTGYGHAG